MILPRTSTRTGPKFFDTRSSELLRIRIRKWILNKSDLPAVHVLHTHNDIARGIEECAMKRDNVRVAAVVHDLELADDLFSYVLLGFDVDDLGILQSCRLQNSPTVPRYYLSRHDDLGGGMHDLADGSSIPRAKLFQHDQILAPKV